MSKSWNESSYFKVERFINEFKNLTGKSDVSDYIDQNINETLKSIKNFEINNISNSFRNKDDDSFNRSNSNSIISDKKYFDTTDDIDLHEGKLYSKQIERFEISHDLNQLEKCESESNDLLGSNPNFNREACLTGAGDFDNFNDLKYKSDGLNPDGYKEKEFIDPDERPIRPAKSSYLDVVIDDAASKSTPIIYKFTFTDKDKSKKIRNDDEPDMNFPRIDYDKEEFLEFIGEPLYKCFLSKDWRDKLYSLNEIQLMFGPESNLDDYCSLMLLGLEDTLGFKESNNTVNLVFIDLIRQIIVKSEYITKSIISHYFEYFIDKIADRRLDNAICDLLLIITEATCPSFVLIQVIKSLSKTKNNVAIINALNVSLNVIQRFGPGDLDINHYMSCSKLFILSQKSNVVNLMSKIFGCLYKYYESSVFKFLENNKVPKSVVQKIINESSNVIDPHDVYYRHRRSTYEKCETTTPGINPVSIKSLIPQELLDMSVVSVKWSDQKLFMETVESALINTDENIPLHYLEHIIIVLIKYVKDGNKNVVHKSLVLLENLAKRADGDVSKLASLVSPCIIIGWCDLKQSIREQATQTALEYRNINLFIKQIASQKKMSSETRLEILNFLYTSHKQISVKSYLLLSAFFAKCFEDKLESVRSSSFRFIHILNEVAPVALENSLYDLQPKTQRKIDLILDGDKDMHFIESESSLRKKRRKSASPVTIHSHRTSDLFSTSIPKASSKRPSSDSKSKKRSKSVNQLDLKEKCQVVKQKSFSVETILKNCKNSAINILGSSLGEKLFSKNYKVQKEAIDSLVNSLNKNVRYVVDNSDVFLTYSLYYCNNSSNSDLVISSLFFMSKLYALSNIRRSDIDLIIKTVLNCIDSNIKSVSEFAKEIFYILSGKSDLKDFLDILVKNINNCRHRSLNLILRELQKNIKLYNKSSDLFLVLIDLLQSNDNEVVKLTEFILSNILENISEHEKSSLIVTLSRKQYSALLKLVHEEESRPENVFTKLSKEGKIKLLEKIQKQAKLKREKVHFPIDDIYEEFLSNELDWDLIIPVLHIVYDIISHSLLDQVELEKFFSYITYFSHANEKSIQKKFEASSIINLIIDKIIKSIPFPTLFSLILEGIESFCDSLSNDSFYCELWRLLVLNINKLFELTNDSKEEILSFTNEKIENYEKGTVKYDLLRTLADSVANEYRKRNNRIEIFQTPGTRMNESPVSSKQIFSPDVSRSISPIEKRLKTPSTDSTKKDRIENKLKHNLVNSPRAKTKKLHKSPVEPNNSYSSFENQSSSEGGKLHISPPLFQYSKGLQHSSINEESSLNFNTSFHNLLITQLTPSNSYESMEYTSEQHSAEVINSEEIKDVISEIQYFEESQDTESSLSEYKNNNINDMVKSLNRLYSKWNKDQE